MNSKERKYWYKIGDSMDLGLIKSKIETLKEEFRNEAIWYILKGVIQTNKSNVDQQCEVIRNLRDFLHGDLATFFNMTKVPGRDHGERLLQHAIIHGKDQLVLTILEEPAVKVSFETSELRSTPLHLALMNGLSHGVIQLLTTNYSMTRKNNQNTTPEDIAKITGNDEFLLLLAERQLAKSKGLNFFQLEKLSGTEESEDASDKYQFTQNKPGASS